MKQAESTKLDSITGDNRDDGRNVMNNEVEHRQNNIDSIDRDEIDAEEKLLHQSNSITKMFRLNREKSEADRMMTEDINKLLRDMPLANEMTCGFWFFKGSFFQKFANQTSYVVLYGLVGCVFSMTYAYFNGTITTIEKRFKIPSKNTGIITVGNDFSQTLLSAVLSYYAGKGHRPRWIGFGLLTIVLFCLLTAAPHFLYGPGEDALSYTVEFGAEANSTNEVVVKQRSKSLCRVNGNGAECEMFEGNLAPQVVLFVAQFISGIGGSLYYTLGVSYMDDNTKKSKTPALLSLSYFLRMLGPALGYALASFCVRIYIAPQLRPVIDDKDPRWLGAWWLGWLILGGILFISGIFLTMFPKELPRAAARRIIEKERKKQKEITNSLEESERDELEKLSSMNDIVPEAKASLKDMSKTFKRLITNKIFMCNNLSSIFYLFGYTPYWIFSPKYIEIQYRQTAATSSLVTGTVALAFSAIGVLLSGFIISRYRPSARYMAGWNVITGFLTVSGIVAYAFIGCPGNEKSVIVNIPKSDPLSAGTTCNSDCHCDYVRYSPVCGENGMTYISPCHAGCRRQHVQPNGQKTFYECKCISNNNTSFMGNASPVFERLTALDLIAIDNAISQNQSAPASIATATESSQRISMSNDTFLHGQAIPGACPVNCFVQFVTFLIVMCCLKFIGATGRASNFLVSVRCVPEKDKAASMGLAMMMMSMLAFIPSPIFFGWVIDRLCLVWGKTCSHKGNCWLYDPKSLRYIMNLTAASFVTIGALFDVGVWYYVKDLKIFDEELKAVEMKIVQNEEEANSEKKTEI